jgi:hypothetical protein
MENIYDFVEAPFEPITHTAAFQFGNKAQDQVAASVGANMGLANVQQGDTEPLGPPLIDLQVLFLIDVRLQTLYLRSGAGMGDSLALGATLTRSPGRGPRRQSI